MKALSVKQPFAGQIASGQKWIEYRPRRTTHRGDLLIVSSLRPTGQGPVGVAVAVVEVVDCEELWDRYAWCLDRIRRVVRPFPVKGQLGMYNVDVPRGCKLARAVTRPVTWDRDLDDPEPDADPSTPIKTWVF